MKVVHKKARSWSIYHLDYLATSIENMMRKHGCVDFGPIAYHLNKTMAACEAKASILGINFVKLTPKIPYKAPVVFHGDMRHLPKHKNGKNVDYMRSWKL